MKPYEYKLLPKLAETGSFCVLEGKYELESFIKGARTFTLADGMRFKLSFTNTGDIVLIRGNIDAEVHTECDRCLEPSKLQIIGEVEGYAVFDEASAGNDLENDEYLVAKGPDGCVDLAPFLYAALIFALPLVVLCDEGCAGICPLCGVNRNEEICSCSLDTIDEDHPFAALKDLF